MSNTRRPKKRVPLDGTAGSATATQPVPIALQHIEWTDEPAAQYAASTLQWISDQRATARRLNAWRCDECQRPFIAFDRHPGATPSHVSHQAFADELDEPTTCGGVCRSVFYNPDGVRQAAADLDKAWVRGRRSSMPIVPTHEWYRPSFDELKMSDRRVRDHVMQGGLLLRKAGV